MCETTETGRELTDEEISEWPELPAVDWEANKKSDISLTASISTEVIDILPALKGEDSHVGILWFTT